MIETEKSAIPLYNMIEKYYEDVKDAVNREFVDLICDNIKDVLWKQLCTEVHDVVWEQVELDVIYTEA